MMQRVPQECRRCVMETCGEWKSENIKSLNFIAYNLIPQLSKLQKSRTMKIASTRLIPTVLNFQFCQRNNKDVDGIVSHAKQHVQVTNIEQNFLYCSCQDLCTQQ